MTDFIATRRDGRVGHIVLDRPKALNALDLDMCIDIHAALDAFGADDAVSTIAISSASPKAFCAGGDIKAIRAAIVEGRPDDALRYFTTEYSMNDALAACPKPTVAVMFGATMGGGLGVSMHGDYRVVTPTLMTSMPETAIGFIPDVGASWTLPRLAGGGQRGLALAVYLGLSGARMGHWDALFTGLATHVIADEQRDGLLATLAVEGVDEALVTVGAVDASSAQETTERSDIAARMDDIEAVFSAPDVPTILDRLQSLGGDWAASTRETLLTMSPTSMAATVELMAAGARAATLRECLDNELRLGRWVCAQPDFAEGVRAVLVDKTRDAAWSPARVADVDVAAIRAALAG